MSSGFDVEGVLRRAERIHDRAAVEQAFDAMAGELTAALGDRDPLVLVVMLGGVYPAVQLTKRFEFLYRMDYLHATRYRGGLAGHALQWRARPRIPLADRHVLIVDDIIDEGVTMSEIVRDCHARGAASVTTAALVRKRHDRGASFEASCIGLDVDDRYVFGCGMDYKEYFRSVPEIYAAAPEDDLGMSPVGLIGGTGISRCPGLEVREVAATDTPYGAPSAPLVHGRLGGRDVVFVARHGDPHGIPPHRVNYRANLWSLHEQGVRQIIAINAVGAIEAALAPGDLVVPDQIVDYTWGRKHSFYEGGAGGLAHIDFSTPYDPFLRESLLEAGAATGARVHGRATHAVTQGPRLETAAEIDRLERDGCAIVGMTGMPEAALARELGLAYACLAYVSNRAAGRGDEPLSAALEQLDAYVRIAVVVVEQALSALP